MVRFAQLLEKATSDALLEPDLALNLQIVDAIRGGDVSGKEAVRLIRRRMLSNSPNVSLKTLIVLEMVVKNCSSPVQSEIATKETMEDMKKIIRVGTMPVKQKALELIQTWGQAFKREPSYKIVPDTYNVLRMEGHHFPEFRPESDAMFVADKAPEWAEGDTCHRCRVAFTLTLRRHHCRACGQIFCHQCSSKTRTLPKLGIEKEVRVCDHCYDQGANAGAGGPASTDGGAAPRSELEQLQQQAMSNANLSPEEEVRRALERDASLAQVTAPPTTKDREQELREEEELQLALAISMSEEEAKKKQQSSYRAAASVPVSVPEPQPAPSGLYDHVGEGSPYDDNPMDKYLASTSRTQASAPRQQDARNSYSAPQQQQQQHQQQQPQQQFSQPQQQVAAPSSAQSDELLAGFENSTQKFMTRLQQAAQQGLGVRQDPTVQSMFQSLSLMHPQVVQRMQDLDEDRTRLLDLQAKIRQTEDARARLNELNRQHLQKLEEQRQEQEMLRRVQLEQKLKLIEQQEREQKLLQEKLEEQHRQELMERQRHEAEEQQRAQEEMMRRHSEQQQQFMYPQQPFSPQSAHHYPPQPQQPPQQQHNIPPHHGAPVHAYHETNGHHHPQQQQPPHQPQPHQQPSFSSSQPINVPTPNSVPSSMAPYGSSPGNGSFGSYPDMKMGMPPPQQQHHQQPPTSDGFYPPQQQFNGHQPAGPGMYPPHPPANVHPAPHSSPFQPPASLAQAGGSMAPPQHHNHPPHHDQGAPPFTVPAAFQHHPQQQQQQPQQQQQFHQPPHPQYHSQQPPQHQPPPKADEPLISFD